MEKDSQSPSSLETGDRFPIEHLNRATRRLTVNGPSSAPRFRSLGEFTSIEREALLSLKPGAGLAFTTPSTNDVKASRVEETMQELCSSRGEQLLEACVQLDHDQNGYITKSVEKRLLDFVLL